VPTGSASLYIKELQHFAFEDLASFFMIKMSISTDTAFNLLFIAACLSLIVSVIKKKLKISHAILFIGGIILLTRGKRFGYEFALLTIPIIKANIFNLSIKEIQNKIYKLLCIIMLTCIAITPFISLKNMFANPPRYPVSYKNLPHGIALFLNHINVGGSVFNHPNNGGYLQWMLRPGYKIFMDMEVPFLFTDEDIYLAGNVFFNDILLKRLISEYNPSFIAVPIETPKFKEMIEYFKHYKIVFFDDTTVLYINGRHYPFIADEYKINAIDPFMLIKQSIISLKGKTGFKPAINELHKILQIYPDCGIANQIMAMIYNNESLYQKAILYEDAIIRNYPELPVGYKLKADSLKGFNEYDKTIENYRIALKKSDVNNKSDIIYMNKEIALIYLKQKHYKRAYKLFKKTINIFSPDTSYRDIYYLSLSASMAGKTNEAIEAYKYGYISVPDDNREWQEKYKDLRIIIGKINEG
jgi:tetratricopeptide (TPR) repeat protein